VAKKRRSVHDPTLSVIHYQEQLEKMSKAYEKSSTRRNQRAVNGFTALKQVTNTVRDYLNEVSVSLKAPVIAQLAVEFIGIAMAFLKASNEGYNYYALSGRVAQIATLRATHIIHTTTLTCAQVGEIINGMLKKLSGVTADPLTFTENDGVCEAKVANPLTKLSVASASTGYTVALTDILKAKTPEEVLMGK
jgi:hypothetical protein